MMYADLQLASDKEEHTLYTFDEKVITDAIKRIYHNEGYKPEMIAEREGKALIDENYRILSQAIDRGIAQYQTEPNDISGHITTEVPAELTAALHNNALLFSGWKGARTMHEAGIHLYNDKGGIKSFEEFSREAGEVFKKQKLNLTAEYRLATQSAAMAAKWSEVEADGDRYNLQYRTAGDSRVREEHARLDGTTLPPLTTFGQCSIHLMDGAAVAQQYRYAKANTL